ncbi:sensor histidine kinase [Actinocrinis puniceicyclus]|uniref:Sensor histidine kinase n=1 Tax=Actinocrinis puniceicyclus TaxID=977794 RepID=A0A8J7WP34_9ACTN|nr:sensor histidine kinase [Actinocrinis puniceicyclus]MBS2963374.1 sensor histidine kinase [Actinocrinis puniceicyclus]
MSDTPVPSDPLETGLRHLLYPYTGAQNYLPGLLAYVDEALAVGASVVVCAPEERVHLLRKHVAAHDAVAYMDAGTLDANPGRLIPMWKDWVDQRGRKGPVYGIAESVWRGRSAAHLSELWYHEWLLNQAFTRHPAWSLLCPFDTADQSQATARALSRSHPLIWDGATSVTGTQYDPGPYPYEPFPDPRDSYQEMPYTIDDLTRVREHIGAWASCRGMAQARTGDLLLAVTEIASNSIRHGGGRGVLRTWAEDGALVCEFRDDGLIADPMVGRRRPMADQIGGCGLWFAHQLCDLVEIRSAPRVGTSVRLHMNLAREEAA